ncbi:uncharacterized protein N7484_004551 [Penicillium longicatenatum]|uniref:uncharacterized protein n=1 Tax=Penicillium longicatenatum TaxID=1561947 RepID=UPI002547B8C9|nr:uncharacterized protein N7484_004551 [Penicillium longicatenatum]KAJ5650828.1 hypothetical protein N7484_004551 [Penicillium longicatenatum]
MAHLFHPGQFHMASQKYNGKTPRCSVMAEKRHLPVQDFISPYRYTTSLVWEGGWGFSFSYWNLAVRSAVRAQDLQKDEFKKATSKTNLEISTCDVVKLRGLLQEQDCGGTSRIRTTTKLTAFIGCTMDISKARNAVIVRKSAWRPER